MEETVKVKVKVKAIEATPESFAEYGQVIEPTADGDEFGPEDAELDLSNGIPRFYILRIKDRPFSFSSITHHARVTQCLGSLGLEPWYLGVAKASVVEEEGGAGEKAAAVVRSESGHAFVVPGVDEVKVFRISGAKFVKLNKGTWHAGPLFRETTRDFFNLELTNTNVVDHTSCKLGGENGVLIDIED